MLTSNGAEGDQVAVDRQTTEVGVGEIEADSTPDEIIEVDYQSDSGYGDESIRSETQSLSSSTYDYHYEHGHRYHRNGQTLLPNDETEQDRLDLQHHIFKLILDGDLTVSKLPSDGAARILDIGTGTGIWPIEMGDKYPAATIVGIDHAPIQPSWVPPNVSFEIDDVNKPWLQSENSFDFIYIRTMAGSITSWPSLMEEVFRVLKPGGKVEVVEFSLNWECQDGSFDPKGNCGTWTKTFHQIARDVLKIDFDPLPKMVEYMHDAGFEKAEERDMLVPVGPWARDPKLKEIGAYFLSNMLESGIENYTMKLFTMAGWEETSVHAMLGGVRRDLLDRSIHAFTRAWYITAVKPL